VKNTERKIATSNNYEVINLPSETVNCCNKKWWKVIGFWWGISKERNKGKKLKDKEMVEFGSVEERFEFEILESGKK
jgi:hypothetical protein